jgi:glutamate/tyrosine decarboxylase-like PLP-dependent enzyme
VVAVVGSTEEGAVDEVHRVAALRKSYEKNGVSFTLYIDAAYGGYARTIFLDENDQFMEIDTLKKILQERKILNNEIDWPKEDIYDAFHAIPEADSVTIDLHKMGYIPYKSGPMYTNDFITSKTDLSHKEYGDAPRSFVSKFEIPEKEWDRVQSVYVL